MREELISNRNIEKVVSLNKREPLFDDHEEVLTGAITHKAVEVLLKTHQIGEVEQEKIERSVETALSIFIHPSNPLRRKIKQSVLKLVSGLVKELQGILSGKEIIYSEVEIWDQGVIRRPDLIAVDKEKKTVNLIDFKTGIRLSQEEIEKYASQIKGYREAIKKILPDYSIRSLLVFSSEDSHFTKEIR